MRTNLIVLLADLFNLFEIHPAKCVTCPGPDQITPGKHVSQTYCSSNLMFAWVCSRQ